MLSILCLFGLPLLYPIFRAFVVERHRKFNLRSFIVGYIGAAVAFNILLSLGLYFIRDFTSFFDIIHYINNANSFVAKYSIVIVFITISFIAIESYFKRDSELIDNRIFVYLCKPILLGRNYFSNKGEMVYKIFYCTVIIIVPAVMALDVLPMILLGEKYVHTIHDGLDSYAGTVQMIYDNRLYFNMNQSMPVMYGEEGKYLMLTYTLYDFYNCVFGYIFGQVLTRITGVLVGFFSMLFLLKRIYPQRTRLQDNAFYLISIAFAISTCAPNRFIAYTSLPLIIYLFIVLNEKKKFAKLTLFALLYPLLAAFSSTLIFVLGFWFIASIFELMRKKYININLICGFMLMCISSFFVNIYYFMVMFTSNESNRSLMLNPKVEFDMSSFLTIFTKNLINGQYHSTSLHKYVILPFLIMSTLCIVVVFCIDFIRKTGYIKHNKLSLILLTGGWLFWFFSAFFATFQEVGFEFGILLLDGFNWRRVIGLMRVVWFLMLASVTMLIKERIILLCFVYGAVAMQLIVIVTTPTQYNSLRDSLENVKHNNQITFEDFFSTELFDIIKDDIDYSGEWVVAYGYHPSVLIYNGFRTLDGYYTVHSMEYQLKFREIIAPALDAFSDYKNYYDGWGGRMYLFGELSFEPLKNEKSVEPAVLLIDTEAFRKYDGKYILSRAEISNADDLGINFVNDYSSNESMYHIYLYEVP